MSIFDDLQEAREKAGIDAGVSRNAQQWFRNVINQTVQPSNVRPRAVLRDQARIISGGRRRRVGKMYSFIYDPKHKDTLPYYDTFPLIFILDIKRNGLLGMNFHYLPTKNRFILFNKLLVLMSNNNLDDTTRLRMTYRLLRNSTKYWKNTKPIVKRYLSRHVRSKFIQIPAVDWPIALALPMARFKKAPKRTVWAESRKIIRNA